MTRVSRPLRVALPLAVLVGCGAIQIGSTGDDDATGGATSGGPGGGTAGTPSSPVPASGGGAGSAGGHDLVGGGPGAAARAGAAGESSGGISANAGATSTSGASGSGGLAEGGASSRAGNTGAGGTSTGGTHSAAGTGGGAIAGSGGSTATCSGANLTLTGRVISPFGTPLHGVVITLSGDGSAITTTDLQGNYGFSGLCPGSYTVQPSAPNLAFCSPVATLPKLRRSTVENFTGSSAGCQPPSHSPKVLVLAFDPDVSWVNSSGAPLSATEGWDDPWELADQLRRAVRAATNGRVSYTLAETQVVPTFPIKVDGAQYSESAYHNCLNDPSTCHQPDTADYADIVATRGLCTGAVQGTLDEVWMFGGPYFGFEESQLVGPQPFSLGPEPIQDPSCPKLVPIMGFNYERGLREMTEGMMRRIESTLRNLYGSWKEDRMDHAFDEFALVAAQSPTYGLSGCGSDSYAPNSTTGFQFDSSDPVLSYCDNFFNYPALGDLQNTAQDVTCTAWGCTEYGFQQYWLGHLPAASGNGPDGRYADWWHYVLVPDEVLAAQPIRCSSVYAPGWCQQVADQQWGTCNVGEWATSGTTTGWVEFHWPTPHQVSSVTLYDRACSEQVIAGHLEFSDGSPPVTFGALEDTGTQPTTVTFAAVEVTWLRIVIDDSLGGENVGFGEILIP